MAMTLSFKMPDAGAVDTVIRRDVYDWLKAVDEAHSSYRVTIVVEGVTGDARSRKMSAVEELRRLAVCSATGRHLWRRKGYTFNFLSKKYVWRKQALHITANEALFLFKWLVEKDEAYFREKWYYLRNLRRRFGKVFLEVEVEYEQE
jgi:NADPH:quinone reductase-like Zn-dependent oxidoreductase